MALSIPFIGSTTAGFGATAGRPNAHRGHDVAPGGPAFPSWVTGTVVTAGYQSALGNRVVVQNTTDGYYIGVSHLASIAVSVGQKVVVGNSLGVIGNTGSASRGRHAHITVSPSSKYPESGAVIDPVGYARGASTAGSGGSIIANFSTDTQRKLQEYCAKGGMYTGLVDGVLGPLSWKAIQTWLTAVGLYGGPIDGEPGTNTYKGLQTVAKNGGYTGPIDGEPGPATDAGLNSWLTSQLAPKPVTPPAGTNWAAWQAFLVGYGYGGPADGVPGSNTYSALQRFLTDKFGYTGPIDGEPGDQTWAAFDRAKAAGYPNAAIPPVVPPVKPPVVVPPKPTVPAVPAGYVFGVDLGSSQKDFDFKAFYEAGGKFAIIKQGGGNASDSPYVAPHYLAQLSRARQVAGLVVGHYWMNGNKNGLTPTTSAQYFARHASIMDGDLIALDIEAIDGVPAYTPDEAWEFITEFQKFFPDALFAIYLNRGLERGTAGWKRLADAGHYLWSATLDGTQNPELRNWVKAAIVQYVIGPVPGSTVPVDSNMGVEDLKAKYGYKRPPVVPPVDPPVEPPVRDVVDRTAVLAAIEAFKKTIKEL